MAARCRTEPVKLIVSTAGASTSAGAGSTSQPCTTLTTPAGMPASRQSRASTMADSGVCSAGLRHHRVAAGQSRDDEGDDGRRAVPRNDDRRTTPTGSRLTTTLGPRRRPAPSHAAWWASRRSSPRCWAKLTMKLGVGVQDAPSMPSRSPKVAVVVDQAPRDAAQLLLARLRGELAPAAVVEGLSCGADRPVDLGLAAAQPGRTADRSRGRRRRRSRRTPIPSSPSMTWPTTPEPSRSSAPSSGRSPRDPV